MQVDSTSQESYEEQTKKLADQRGLLIDEIAKLKATVAERQRELMVSVTELKKAPRI